MTLHAYYEQYGSRITQASERLFVEEFLYPLLGSKIFAVEPQFPFIDRTGSSRRIDFAYHGSQARLALEVNGETYHAEGIIPDGMFDENLFRQNEIIRLGYHLVRFSYSQLQSPRWRPLIADTIRELFSKHAPELLEEYALAPTVLQGEVLDALSFYRDRQGWRKGVVVLPTGTGKTILSALDARRFGGPILFLVHRLDILSQSIEAYKKVWPDLRVGQLTGVVRDNELTCDVLFASKDSLRLPSELARFPRDWFRYVVVDEVHHGQSPTYRDVLSYFTPSFMLGMTATPDRTDRRDIFELFDYKKIFEMPLSEAIERGFLVPYSYYGLTDNVDYSRIRHHNHKYRVDDLERLLVIPERNEAVLRKYLELGQGDKAIGFCVSIDHADRMAQFFCSNGVAAAAIHSASANRDELVREFREDRLQVVFTVDLFNEGVDFPNVRILLFLRPTESKTVFLQQLGRGLRLCSGKDRVRVLDFIGNYKRANQVRKYLASSSSVVELTDNGTRTRKTLYLYSTGCEVHFDQAVEQILDRQDAEELGFDKEDLKQSYFALAEKLGRKPGREDLDREGEHKCALYARLFGSWVAFLREVGEYTEASYHYPQGTHLGHILSIVKAFGLNERSQTQWDDEYIRLRGGLGVGRISTYRRQVKYKLQAAMELGLLPDDRTFPVGTAYPLELTPLGREFFGALRPVLDSLEFTVDRDEEGIPTSRMPLEEKEYNRAIRRHLDADNDARRIVHRVFLRMHAVQQMLHYLYHVKQTATVKRSVIYDEFFHTPAVRQFCDREGIDEATEEAAKRRCPFLLNILDACGILETQRGDVVISLLVLAPPLVRPYEGEDLAISIDRLRALSAAWPMRAESLSSEDLSILRELFGPAFLTDAYHVHQLEVLEDLH